MKDWKISISLSLKKLELAVSYNAFLQNTSRFL